MMRKIVLSAIVLIVSAFAFAQTRTAPVKVEGGMIEGVVIDGVSTYLGIPFAAPPVGELRWKKPQPVQPWQGVRLCDRFAPAPMQNMNARRPKVWKNVAEMNPTTSEDCLYLNVFAPAKKSEKPYPVMVWIYGGGFHQGGTDGPVYRGNKYAKEGVIMVSIAYRLGVFGYLAHPELSKESGHGSGNYALYDQIAGLKWVKENIAAFGGDPDNVTAFGQSAGSRSIQGLLCAKGTEGLFQRAIPQSGCAIREDAKCLPLNENEALGKAFFESMGITSLEAMRAVDAVTLQQFYQNSTFTPKFRPAIDGYLIVEDFNDATLGGRYLDIDYMIGYTKFDALNDYAMLEAAAREDLNARALRVSAVLNPVKLIVTNYPEGKTEEMEAVNNPERPEDGTHTITFSRELWIERDDFMEEAPKKFFRMVPGKEVRLKNAYIVKCTGCKKAADGTVEEIYCEYDPESRSGMAGADRKVKGTLHWVSVSHCLDAEVRLYDRLFTVENPAADERDFRELLNPDSLTVLKNCHVESYLAEAAGQKYLQFQRIGYFTFDKSSTPDHLVFNRTVGLKDSWAKK